MFGYMLSQWYLSVVCDVRAPYSRGFNFSGIFLHHIVALPSGNSPTKNHEDRPRGSPPTGALNARGTSSLYVWLSHLVMSFLYILRVVTNTSLKMDPHFGSAGVQKYLHCRKCDWRLCCCWWNYCWKFCQIFLGDLYSQQYPARLIILYNEFLRVKENYFGFPLRDDWLFDTEFSKVIATLKYGLIQTDSLQRKNNKCKINVTKEWK